MPSLSTPSQRRAAAAAKALASASQPRAANLPQVIHGVAAAIGTSRVHPQCMLAEQSGRGNNWAAGFHGPPGGGGRGGGGSVCDAALEALRWQWERRG